MFRALWPHPVLRQIFIALVLTSVEAFIAFACLVSGIPILINPASLAPSSALALLPGWSIYPWASGLTIGGALSLAGIAFTQFRIERAGVMILIATMGVYAFALVSLLPNSFLTVTMFSLFTLAMFGRYWVLGKLLIIDNLKLQIALEEQRERED